jgi:hypothetical protein
LVDLFDSWYKLGGSSIFFKDVKKKIMIGHVIGFDEVNKCNIWREVVAVPNGE